MEPLHVLRGFPFKVKPQGVPEKPWSKARLRLPLPPPPPPKTTTTSGKRGGFGGGGTYMHISCWFLLGNEGTAPIHPPSRCPFHGTPFRFVPNILGHSVAAARYSVQWVSQSSWGVRGGGGYTVYPYRMKICAYICIYIYI